MYSSNRRSKLELTIEILQIIWEGIAKPTKIMYAVGMSWVPTIKILGKLTEAGYLELEKLDTTSRSTKRYTITERGKSVCKQLVESNDLLTT